MTTRQGRPFFPIHGSTSASFNSTALTTAEAYMLESTDRIWQGPSNRAIRTANFNSSAAYYIKLGTSTVVANEADSILAIGAWPVEIYVNPSQTYISIVSSTTVTVNVSLGYGG